MKGHLARARHASPPDLDWLIKLFDAWSERAVGAAGAAGAGTPEGTAEDPASDLEDVSVEEIEGDSVWNAELWITEAAEAILGREAYDGLFERFAALPGVEQIEWEDREKFLLRLRPGTNVDAVRVAARRALRDAQSQRML